MQIDDSEVYRKLLDPILLQAKGLHTATLSHWWLIGSESPEAQFEMQAVGNYCKCMKRVANKTTAKFPALPSSLIPA